MNVKKVLLIYTGGTIGMAENPETGELYNIDFEHLLKEVPELKRVNAIIETCSINQAIDSAEITSNTWIEIAKIIRDNYKIFDGFVILHGTDTMAYTASALSFMIEGLSKPVIITGSQLPVGQIRTDGKEHIITSIELASKKDHDFPINEVCIYFNNKLMRGNRCKKISASNFNAFDSPSFPELINTGVTVKYNNQILPFFDQRPLGFNLKLNTRVVIIKCYPSMNWEIYKGLFDKKLNDGIVLETFGSGNLGLTIQNRELFNKFIKDGGILVNVSQTLKGSTSLKRYVASNEFHNMKIIHGHDMTVEAAITKLMVCLGNGNIDKMTSNIAGEMTLP